MKEQWKQTALPCIFVNFPDLNQLIGLNIIQLRHIY